MLSSKKKPPFILLVCLLFSAATRLASAIEINDEIIELKQDELISGLRQPDKSFKHYRLEVV